MTDRIGSKVRMILVGDRIYHGEIIEEDTNTITILDKFNSEVSIGKASLISLEVLDGN
jgi:hypothetical protein